MSSGKWRVYNTHRDGLVHREKFKDDFLEIKAGEYILMDYEDAVQFKGQYFPMKMDAMGQQDPKSFKMIKIEPDGPVAVSNVVTKYVCHLDGKEFPTRAALDAYMKQFEGQAYKDTELEEQIKAAKVDEPVVQRRKPGPKPKEKVDVTVKA